MANACLAIVIVLYATQAFYPTFGFEGRVASAVVALVGLAALASLTYSTFRQFLEPAINGARRGRKRNA